MNTFGGPAFPLILPGHTDADGFDSPPKIIDEGMSLRDYFAGQAMATLVEAAAADPASFASRAQSVAEFAYAYADAMLDKREATS